MSSRCYMPLIYVVNIIRYNNKEKKTMYVLIFFVKMFGMPYLRKGIRVNLKLQQGSSGFITCTLAKHV